MGHEYIKQTQNRGKLLTESEKKQTKSKSNFKMSKIHDCNLHVQ
jgi:hypothetical protein